MRNLLFLTLVSGLTATAACSDSDTNAPPTANAVIPAQGFIGRKLRVEVSGDNTNWTSAATVSFGDGVTVGTVNVASPTDLFADITISPTAAAGLRDVKVSDSGVDSTLTQAFELNNPLTVSIQGTLAQGSIAGITIQNHDFDTPFAASADLTVSAGPGVAFNIGSSDAYSITATMLIDTDAASGAIQVVSGSGAAAVTSPGDMVAIASRTATALTAGMATTGTEMKALDTTLYSFTAGATPAFLQIAASTTNTTAKPRAVVLGASGHFADLIDAAKSVALVSTASQKMFVIYFDNSGASGYSFSVKPTVTVPASSVTEAEPNDNKTQATATTTFPVLFTGTLATDADEDWIKVVIPTGAAKKIHVITTAPGGLADTELHFVDNNGTELITGGVDAALGEDASTAALAAGTYFVRIIPSSLGVAFGYAPADDPYQALITLE